MLKKIFLAGFMFICAVVCAAQPSGKLSAIGEGWSRTTVNTAIFRSNSVVTCGDTQFVAYYDSESYLVLAKRNIKEDSWSVNRTQYTGNCSDAHNIISIAADGNGFLHVSWNHHVNKLNYAVSVEPYSILLGEKRGMTGVNEDRVTYPEFYRMPDGGLLFAYRDGRSGSGNLAMKRYDPAGKSWNDVSSNLIDGEGKRNAYWQMCVDAAGSVHISWVWRETADVATNHDMCYARSDDGGRTWKKSSGERYNLPINAANAEYVAIIPQQSELINQTSMSTDNLNRPYIATYWRDKGDSIPQYRLVYFDGNIWKSVIVGKRHTPFSLSGVGTKKIPISRPRLATVASGKKTKAYYIFRDGERGSKVSVAVSGNIEKGRWKTYDLTEFSVDSWEPSYDTELWKNKKKLSIFVQRAGQGDGEKSEDLAPQTVYIMDVK